MAVTSSGNLIRLTLEATNILTTIWAIVFTEMIISQYRSLAMYFSTLLDLSTILPPVILLIICLVLISFLIYGCFGIFSNNDFDYQKYAWILILIFFIQVSVGCYFLFEPKKTFENFFESINAEFENTNALMTSENESINKSLPEYSSYEMITFLQIEVKCCGVYGPDDYFADFEVPEILFSSCCTDCNFSKYPCDFLGNKTKPCQFFYRKGCAEGLSDYINERASSSGQLAIYLAYIELAAIIQALLLSKNFRS